LNEPSPAVDECARAVIGCAIEVHRTLGPGFLEAIYEQALAVEMELRNIPFVRQPVFELAYKSRPIGTDRLDFLVDRQLVVELKAVEQLTPVHTAQVVSYLKATNLHLGLLLNFNVRQLVPTGVKRVVRS